MSVGFKCRLKDWSRFPEPVPAASGIMVQPFRTATACELDMGRTSIRVMQRAKPGSNRQGDDKCCHDVKP